jgi:hypothetical protein
VAAQLADKFLLFSRSSSRTTSPAAALVAVTLLAYTVPRSSSRRRPRDADRVDRKLIMFCATSAGRPVRADPHRGGDPRRPERLHPPLVITLVFSAVGQLFGPAEAAVIPTILPREALITANSMALRDGAHLVVGACSRRDLETTSTLPTGARWALLVVAGALIFASDIPKLERHTSRRSRRAAAAPSDGGRPAGRGSTLRASRGLRLAFGQVSIAVLVL